MRHLPWCDYIEASEKGVVKATVHLAFLFLKGK